MKAYFLAAALCTPLICHAQTPSNDSLVSFSVSATKSVPSDEFSAYLSTTVQAKTASALADKINPTIAFATDTTKNYPSVNISTNTQYSQPNYDANGKLTGFTAKAGVMLKSQDSIALSALIGQLQSQMVLDDLQFSVSDAAQKIAKDALFVEASNTFKSQADAIAKNFGASKWRLVKADLNHSGYGRPVVMMAMSEASAKSASFEITPENTTISYDIHATIALQN